MDEGTKLGVSSRGKEVWKTAQPNGGDDFYLQSPDIKRPIAPKLRRRYYGGKEWVWNNGPLENHVADLKKKFDVKASKTS